MIKRFYRDRLYIGVSTQQKDSFGTWIDVATAKVFHGKPDLSFYGDEVYEYTPEIWEGLRRRIQVEAVSQGREFVEVTMPRQPLLTSYTIWTSSRV